MKIYKYLDVDRKKHVIDLRTEEIVQWLGTHAALLRTWV